MEEVKKLRDVFYNRTSTFIQRNSGTIENQKMELDRYRALNNLNIVDTYNDDGESGSKPFSERPEGRRLLNDAKNKKFDRVWVLKVDRFGRDVLDSLNTIKELHKYDVELKSATENIEEKVLLYVLLALAEQERDNIRYRSAVGRERAVSEGRWTGGPPTYGYIVNKDTKKFERFEPEAEIVKKISGICLNKRLSCPKIAKILKDENIPPFTPDKNKPVKRNIKDGKIIYNATKWYAARIRQILIDETYTGVKKMGKRSGNGVIKEMQVPQIISVEEFKKAQEILSANFIKSTRRARHKYLLSRLIKCGMNGCNRDFSGHVTHGFKYYSCNGNRFHNKESAEKCFNKSINADDLEDTIWKDIVSFIRNPEAITEFLMEKNKEINTDYSSDIKRIDKEIEQRKKEVDRILDFEIPEESFIGKNIKIKLEKLNKEIEKLEEEKSAYVELQNKVKGMKENLTEIEKNLSVFLHIIDNPSFDIKKEITSMLVDKIVVNPLKENDNSRTVEIIYKWSNNSGYITKLAVTG